MKLVTRWMRAFRREPLVGLGMLVLGLVGPIGKNNMFADWRVLWGEWLADRDQPDGARAERERAARTRNGREKLFGG